MDQITIPPPVPTSAPPPTPPVPQPFKASGPKDERMWAMLCHLITLSGLVIPFGNIIGPLVIWLIKREEYGLVNDQGKEALNFQITMLIGMLICIPLFFLFCIGWVLAILLTIFDLVFTIIAAIKANEGVCYRYPMCIRFIK
jgi:uncharacterized Tic20 family protein